MRLNIGCCCNWRVGYVNVDVCSLAELAVIAAGHGWPQAPAEGADFAQVDLREPWPWADGSAEEIVAENMLEHFDPEGLTHLLAEAFRVMQPGATMTGHVPDIDRIVAYAQVRSKWEWAPEWTKGPYDEPSWNALHNFCYGWGHKQVFRMPMLQARLKGAGFEATVAMSEEHALYFVATKPK